MYVPYSLMYRLMKQFIFVLISYTYSTILQNYRDQPLTLCSSFQRREATSYSTANFMIRLMVSLWGHHWVLFWLTFLCAILRNNSPSIWFRYVDYTFSLFNNKEKASRFLRYLKGATSRYFKSFLRRPQPSVGKPKTNGSLMKEKIKGVILKQKGTKIAEDGEDWNGLEMTIFKSLANFLKMHERWRSSFNSRHPNIKLTMELEENQEIPFLDVLIKRHQNTFSTTVYRKKIFTGLYFPLEMRILNIDFSKLSAFKSYSLK